MPEASLTMWSRLTARVLIALSAFALLFTTVGAGDPVSATGLSAQISANRRSQLYYESAMRAHDQTLGRIKSQARITNMRIKQAKRSIKQLSRAIPVARKIITERSARLARLEAKYTHPSQAPDPANYKARVRTLRRELAKSKTRRKRMGSQLRATIRARKYRQQRLSYLKRQKRPTVARREAAEGALASRIVQMTHLAHLRAENQTAVRLAAGSTFEWPSPGRIVQTYGCTGFRLNPRRGSCRHFHDGLDIVSGYGSTVRSAAVGVVAYTGWNPWDEHGRAWIIVISHPDGYVTRYGHMLPTKRVRVGQLVRKGQAIGKMGNTGMSTGTHVHFELLRGSTTVNPLAYMPSGVVKHKKAKADKKKAKGKKGARKQEAKKKNGSKGFRTAAKAKKARRAARSKDSTEDSAAPVVAGFATATAANACQPGDAGIVRPTGDDDADAAYDLASGTPADGGTCQPDHVPTKTDIAPAAALPAPDPGPTSREDEGVPRPFRGTSAVPA